MGYIKINLYLKSLNGDFHDIYIENFEKKVEEIRAYAKKCGKTLIFLPQVNDVLDGLPVESDLFCDIEYTDSLSEEERERYISYVREFMKNAEFDGEYLEEYYPEFFIRFKRGEGEIRKI